MVRTSRGGSVLSFVVGGFLLLALFLGGAYVVRQRTLQIEKNALESSSQQQEQSKKPTDNEDGSPTKEAHKQETPPVSPPQDAGKSEDTDIAATSLPQTGSARSVLWLSATGLLSLVVISYVRSRRPELHFDF
jgi:LPXTG-motif cell wall-anchored protein